MQGPGVYVSEAMAASGASEPAVVHSDASQHAVVHIGASQPAVVHNGASQPVVAETEGFLSGERARWAECIKVAPPRNRNRSEMELAFNDVKERFYNSPDQLSQDQRCSKKRSRLNVYLKQVFGHHNGIWDYLATGDMPPLSPAMPPLPLHERVLESACKRRRVT